jgi:hypothetical protein
VLGGDARLHESDAFNEFLEESALHTKSRENKQSAA